MSVPVDFSMRKPIERIDENGKIVQEPEVDFAANQKPSALSIRSKISERLDYARSEIEVLLEVLSHCQKKESLRACECPTPRKDFNVEPRWILLLRKKRFSAILDNFGAFRVRLASAFEVRRSFFESLLKLQHSLTSRGADCLIKKLGDSLIGISYGFAENGGFLDATATMKVPIFAVHSWGAINQVRRLVISVDPREIVAESVQTGELSLEEQFMERHDASLDSESFLCLQRSLSMNESVLFGCDEDGFSFSIGVTPVRVSLLPQNRSTESTGLARCCNQLFLKMLKSEISLSQVSALMIKEIEAKYLKIP